MFEVKGAHDAAIAQCQKARALNDDPRVSRCSLAFLPCRVISRRRKNPGSNEEATQERYVSAYSFALVYVGLGDEDDALRWLEQSYKDRSGADIGISEWTRCSTHSAAIPDSKRSRKKLFQARNASGRSYEMNNSFAQLKRRNVYKVTVAYAVAGWAFAQGIAQVFPVFGVPNWTIQLIVLLIVIGFPVALVLAWAFEITPEGLKRTEDV